jgi:pentatricopeptide repeat protein
MIRVVKRSRGQSWISSAVELRRKPSNSKQYFHQSSLDVSQRATVHGKKNNNFLFRYNVSNPYHNVSVRQLSTSGGSTSNRDDAVRELQQNVHCVHEQTKAFLHECSSNPSCLGDRTRVQDLMGRLRKYQKQLDKTNLNGQNNEVLAGSVQLLDQFARALMSSRYATTTPALETLEAALQGWARLKTAAAPTCAHALLDGFASTYKFDTAVAVRRHQLRYHFVMAAWSFVDPKKCVDLLQTMKTEEKERRIQLINEDSLGYPLGAYARQGNMERVQELWEELRARQLHPSPAMYYWHIKACEKLFVDRYNRKYLLMAHDLLLEEYKAFAALPSPRDKRRIPHPSSVSVVATLLAQHLGPLHAVKFIDATLALENACPEVSGLVHERLLLRLMQNFNKTKQVDGAEAILNKLLSLDHLKPTRKHFGVVMDGYASLETIQARQKVEAILLLLEEASLRVEATDYDEPLLTTTCYAIVMKSYLKTSPSNAVEPIRKLLQRMGEMSIRLKDPNLRPNGYTYNALMSALIQRKSPGYELEVDELFYEFKADPALRKDTTSMAMASNLAIQAWIESNSPLAMDRVGAVFDATENPRKLVYASLFRMYGKASRLEKIMDLFHRMQSHLGQSENVADMPDVKTYSYVLWSIAATRSSNCWNETMIVFEGMLQRYKIKQMALHTDSMAVAALLQILATCKRPLSKHVAAESMLQRLREVHGRFKHTHYTVSLLSKACRSTTGTPNDKKEAFFVVVKALQELLNDGPFTDDLFREVLLACNTLLVDSNDRMAAVQDLFKLAANAGVLSRELQASFESECTRESYVSLVGLDPLDPFHYDSLPSVWKRNVKL